MFITMHFRHLIEFYTKNRMQYSMKQQKFYIIENCVPQYEALKTFDLQFKN